MMSRLAKRPRGIDVHSRLGVGRAIIALLMPMRWVGLLLGLATVLAATSWAASMPATERVSVSSSGGQASGLSFEPALSGNGRLVAFQSLASDLVPGDTNGTVDVFVFDRRSRRLERVSVSSSGTEATAEPSRSSRRGFRPADA
jgi:hypothetical protein